jgi:hypothetical protein
MAQGLGMPRLTRKRTFLLAALCAAIALNIWYFWPRQETRQGIQVQITGCDHVPQSGDADRLPSYDAANDTWRVPGTGAPDLAAFVRPATCALRKDWTPGYLPFHMPAGTGWPEYKQALTNLARQGICYFAVPDAAPDKQGNVSVTRIDTIYPDSGPPIACHNRHTGPDLKSETVT